MRSRSFPGVRFPNTRRSAHRSRARCCARRTCRRPEVRRSRGLGVGLRDVRYWSSRTATARVVTPPQDHDLGSFGATMRIARTMAANTLSELSARMFGKRVECAPETARPKYSASRENGQYKDRLNVCPLPGFCPTFRQISFTFPRNERR
jgi:hypothetical protein